jgi:DNA-binding transcriptional MerR regulator
MKESQTEARFRIGQLAAMLDLNPKTIRYYEEIGLLPPASRAANGYRVYSKDDQHRLHFIQQAKAVGLTLEEIGEVLAIHQHGMPPCRHVIQLIDHKIETIDEQLRTLTVFRQTLANLRQSAAMIIPTDACVCGIIEQHSEHVTEGNI